jgi:hypothetical protein
MSQPNIEVSEVTWFAGYGHLELGDPCDHDCAHQMQRVIAWGPTKVQYQLVACDDCGCRAWDDYRANDGQEHRRFWMERADWRKVAA